MEHDIRLDKNRKIMTPTVAKLYEYLVGEKNGILNIQ